MQTASQLAREALKTADMVIGLHTDIPKDAGVFRQIKAALAALSEQSGDGDANRKWIGDVRWELERQRPFNLSPHDVPRLREIEDALYRLSDCDRLRERVKELEGAIGKVLPELGAMERSPYLKHHATIVYCQSKLKDALQPAAPQ